MNILRRGTVFDMLHCTALGVSIFPRPRKTAERADVWRRLSGAEAQGMDPQNRVLLEQAALALADAAPVTGPLTDTRTGVYIGCMYQVQLPLTRGSPSYLTDLSA